MAGARAWVFAALIAALAFAAFAAPARVQDAAKRAWFRHEDHVFAEWGPQNEQPRDCRGCHQYEAGADAADIPRPADLCANCHLPEDADAPKKFDVSRARVKPHEESGDRFNHGTHLAAGKLICADCHYAKGPDGSWVIPSPSAGARSIALCVECHESEHREPFNDGISDMAERRRTEQEPFPLFRHSSHLTAADMADGKGCERCHSAIERASAQTLGEVQFDTKSCAQCHVGMKFSASLAGADGAPVSEPSEVAAVFDHSQHFAGRRTDPGNNVATPQAYEALERDGCLACHAWDASAGPGGNFKLGQRFAARDAHDACATCHVAWKSAQHGETDHCAKCHKIEPGELISAAKQASNRPTHEIARFDPQTFGFQTQSHVMIHGAGGAEQSCAQCHRAKLDKQPSRIGVQPFRHASHVPAGAATTAVCRTCHFVDAVPTSLEDSSAPKDAPRGGELVSVSYDARSCAACHGADAAQPSFAPAPRTSTLAFDHRAHLGRKRPWAPSEELECADCHVASQPGAELEITRHDKVLDCTLCHGHDPAPNKCAPIGTREQVEGCIKCHDIGVPAKGQVVPVARAVVALDTDSWQKHSGDQACATCHRVNGVEPLAPAAAREPFERVLALGASKAERNPHQWRIAANRGRERDEQSYVNFFQEASCFDCHWHRIASANRDQMSVQQAAEINKSGPEHLLRMAKALRGSNYRSEFGAWIGAKYPGTFPGIPPKKR